MSNILEKYNKAEFDAFFEGLIAKTDKVIAMNKAQDFTYPGDPGPEPLAEAVTKEDL